MSRQEPKKYKESFFNLHFTSTISISLVLFLIGLIVSLYLTTHFFTLKSKENVSMSIILNDSITDEDFTRLKNYLDATEYTKQVVYISKDSALQEHIKAMGEDPSQFLGYNPLNASLEVYLDAKYTHVDSINNIILPRLQIFDGITNISYQHDMIEMLTNNVNKLSLILSVIALVMFFSFRGVYELVRMHSTKHNLPKGYIYTLPIISSLLVGLIGYLFYNLPNLLVVTLPLIIIYFITLLVIGTFSKKIKIRLEKAPCSEF